MRVKDVIESLQKHYKPDEKIIFAYWDKDFFQDIINDEETYTLTKEDIENICEYEYNFESINDQIQDVIIEVLQASAIRINENEEEQELWDTETEQDNGSNLLSTGTDN